MKQIFLFSTILFNCFIAFAQNYESIKTMMILQQHEKAKEQFEKSITNEKFASKPEAYILKATIYGALADDSKIKGTSASEVYANEADAAFEKYKQMDPALTFLNDILYQNGPINIYSAFFSIGYKYYDDKNWLPGFQKFKKVVDYGDLLINKKVINIAADTNSLLLAGITAESAGLKEEAIKYYTRLADMKVSGDGYSGIYKYLMKQYISKNNITAFDKYREIGRTLYPTDEYFTFDKVDFAAGLETDLNKRIKALEDILISDPNNEKASQLLGEIIYDTLNSLNAGAVQPADADILEKRMIKAFNKVNTLNPSNEYPLIYMGDHFINKTAALNNLKDAKYIAAQDAAYNPYMKAAAIFSQKTNLTTQQKRQYKKVVGYLADICEARKNRAKDIADEFAKQSAEEKKWSDLYKTIK